MDEAQQERWWLKCRFRDDTVYALCDEGGALRSVDGLVPIRYRPAGKEYRTRPERLERLETVRPERLPEPVAPSRPAPVSRPKAGSAGGTWRSDDEVVQLWTDGACSGNPGPAGAGVYRRHKGEEQEISEYLGEGTNNIAELTAILLGLRTVTDPDQPIDVITDSTYCIGLLTQGWKAKANQELVAELRGELARHRDVRLVKVKGHAGVDGNERADSLAVEAVATGTQRTEQS